MFPTRVRDDPRAADGGARTPAVPGPPLPEIRRDRSSYGDAGERCRPWAWLVPKALLKALASMLAKARERRGSSTSAMCCWCATLGRMMGLKWGLSARARRARRSARALSQQTVIIIDHFAIGTRRTHRWA